VGVWGGQLDSGKLQMRVGMGWGGEVDDRYYMLVEMETIAAAAAAVDTRIVTVSSSIRLYIFADWSGRRTVQSKSLSWCSGLGIG